MRRLVARAAQERLPEADANVRVVEGVGVEPERVGVVDALAAQGRVRREIAAGRQDLRGAQVDAERVAGRAVLRVAPEVGDGRVEDRPEVVPGEREREPFEVEILGAGLEVAARGERSLQRCRQVDHEDLVASRVVDRLLLARGAPRVGTPPAAWPPRGRRRPRTTGASSPPPARSPPATPATTARACAAAAEVTEWTRAAER